MVRKRKTPGHTSEQSLRKRYKDDAAPCQSDVENSLPAQNAPENLYGREKEVALLGKLLHKGIVDHCPTSIFLAGPPGTGKTLAVKTVLKNMVSQYNERDILAAVLNGYRKCSKKFSVDKLFLEYHRVHLKGKQHTIIVLDEIDYVRPKDHDFLCSMFHWPLLCENVSLIGIANTLNMMELLKHKLKSVPQPIVFGPYTEGQLQLILSKKLKTSNRDAVELCARKVAAMTGDARKAVQVAKSSLSVDLLDGNACRNVFSTINNVYGSPLVQSKIPIQQKILLAAMLYLTGENSSNTVEKGSLLATYKKLCELLLLPALEMDEIYEALSLLEAQSVLKLKYSSYQLLVDKEVAGKMIAYSSLISQINISHLDKESTRIDL